MKVDLTKLIINSVSSITINEKIEIEKEYIENTLIDELKNIKFIGKIYIDESEDFILTGNITGTMILKDDLTLEPVEYEFNALVEETLEQYEKIIDITNLIVQNILVEIPSKVRKSEEKVELYGDGWRVISEEEFEREMAGNNNPFSNLNEILIKKEED